MPLLIKKSVKASAETAWAKIKNPMERDVRLFFALWPDAAQQQRLHKLARPFHESCGGRMMRADTLHMTLLFLGEVSRSRLPELMAAAGRVAVPEFALDLSRFECWRHNRIGYLAPENMPEALGALAAALSQEVAASGFSFDRRAFKAHITILRNLRAGAKAVEVAPPMHWKVNAFSLMQSLLSERGASYRVIHSWPLVSAATTS